MPKCENCYHYEMCQSLEDSNKIKKINATSCSFYRDKSLIVELPCKIGDTVYIHYVLLNEIKQMKIDGIKVHKEFIQVIFSDNTTLTVWNNDWSDYENTVFRTREDAEKRINND